MDRVGSLRQDREALLALYWSSGGPRWTRKQGWANNDEDLGGWYGVTCNKEGRVVRLDLNKNGLVGTIPSALGGLTNLVYLRMSSNNLTGPIPCTFGNLTRLNYLDIRSNQLTGSLPASLGKLTDVAKLDLSCNLLGGHIPHEMGEMTGLLLLWLEKNHIQGPIPPELANIPQLTDLDLAENRVEEGRLQGKVLMEWKDKARKRLIPKPSGRGSRTDEGAWGKGKDGTEGRGVSGSFDLQEYMTNMMAKDREIAELKAQIEQHKKRTWRIGSIRP